MTNRKPGIRIFGAGNIAWHLGHQLRDCGYVITGIHNRTAAAGKQLAAELQTHYQSGWKIADADTGILILAVSDSFLPELVNQMDVLNEIVLHTAGSISMKVLSGKFESYGVLYPFQTLTKGIPADFSRIPICIEASNPDTLSRISTLAGELSEVVRPMDSIQRKQLHLAGVILNNFTNHLIARSSDYLKKQDIDFGLIIPLLRETLDKLEKTSPYEAQTGPARRNDRAIIQEHLRMLADEPELKNLYSLITDSIIAYYSGS